MEDLSEIHTHFWQNDCLLINPRHGIILIKPYHAEFAGLGSVISNNFDRDVIDILAVGSLSLTTAKFRGKTQRLFNLSPMSFINEANC